MKRAMSDSSNGTPAKMARTANHPIPQNTSTELQNLQARIAELEKKNAELRDSIRAGMAQAREEFAQARADLKSSRDHDAKLQAEKAALDRPRRRTALRQQAEECQEKVETLEGELQDINNENEQLRGIITNSEQERDLWRSHFEDTQKAVNSSQTVQQNTGHHTPLLSDAGNYFQTQFLNGVGPLPSPGLEQQEPSAEAGSGPRTIPTAPTYQPPNGNSKVTSTGADFVNNNPQDPHNTQPGDASWEPNWDSGLNLEEDPNNTGVDFNPNVDPSSNGLDFSLHVDPNDPEFDTNIDIEAFLNEVAVQDPPAN
ncbi:uncharacterized protein GGS25DRAFT_521265 [Hypoxylon fragiforme]|uniref:uncharacterized protein n=1 Tax=Hypoxylon fragiforme TaxID=63214 RepID=UPI0020C5C934|nr:uncharacterized protein GGS25DRAFT_521265 [Hypoxylon fragiforme]KAI2608098.1 hypothetical protein GGS25DRAFT_521265 [Hypoxylon fragiforme]